MSDGERYQREQGQQTALFHRTGKQAVKHIAEEIEIL